MKKNAERALPDQEKAKPGDPGDLLAPRRIFEEMFPQALQARQDLARNVGKKFHFCIFGDGGGEWVVDLAGPCVQPGGMEKADLYLEMNSHDFGEMVRGRMAGNFALRSGRLRGRGDFRLLGVLGRLLASA